MTERKFLKCAFREGGAAYTYHYEGEDPLAPGDKVTVETKHGTASAIVVIAMDEIPPFETRAVIGKKVEEETTQAELEARGLA